MRPRAVFRRRSDTGISPHLPRRGAMVLPMPEPTQSSGRSAGRGLAGARSTNSRLAAVVSRFRLSFGRIGQAATTRGGSLGPRRQGRHWITARDLQEACRQHSTRGYPCWRARPALPTVWNDIVLPATHGAAARDLQPGQHRDRVYDDWGFDRKLALGKGLSVLFAGPPGTGKTMAAEIIAGELGLDLYKIDLSTVVSKYIGETEKNLARIFDEAETANAILFFDEADALFGKRSEVQGLARPLRQHRGRLPAAADGGVRGHRRSWRPTSARTWTRRSCAACISRSSSPSRTRKTGTASGRGFWPEDTPLDRALDLGLLAARYEMAGGNIKNVALAAAFLAAADGEVVAMRHVAQATLREYQKTGKLMVEAHELAAQIAPDAERKIVKLATPREAACPNVT